MSGKLNPTASVPATPSLTQHVPPPPKPTLSKTFTAPHPRLQSLFDLSANIARIPRLAFLLIAPLYLLTYYQIQSYQAPLDTLNKNSTYVPPTNASPVEAFLGRLGAEGRNTYRSYLLAEFPLYFLMAAMYSLTVSVLSYPLVDHEAKVEGQTIPPHPQRRPRYASGLPPTLLNTISIPLLLLSVAYNILLLDILSKFSSETGLTTSTYTSAATGLRAFRYQMLQTLLLFVGMILASGWGKLLSQRLKGTRGDPEGIAAGRSAGAGAGGPGGKPPIPGLSRIGELSDKTWKQAGKGKGKKGKKNN
ncbi:hypothetical protein HDV00_006574 [Rhizophlyctis rosea]|nr:hypothetical protein HDV00_006574 [Rhizophlyctis rosea]